MGGLVAALSIYYTAWPGHSCLRRRCHRSHIRPVICMSARREHYLVFVEFIFNELPTCLLLTTKFSYPISSYHHQQQNGQLVCTRHRQCGKYSDGHDIRSASRHDGRVRRGLAQAKVAGRKASPR